jgi:hypothetical protein
VTTSTDTCTPLPLEYQQHPGDGYALTNELIGAIKDAIRNSDRTLQRMIGPSEIGHPCNRWIGYKQLHIPERPRAVPWKATVGTGVHMWLETALDRYNLQHYELLGYNERFYIETKVGVGEINAESITGHCDVYDRVTGTVIDWKGLALTTPIPTPTGWTTMGAVQVGDQVFGSDGQPCTVTAKSNIKRIGTYIVRFDDGSEVVCDSEHIWWTQATGETEPTAKPIDEIIATLTKWGQKSHRVPVVKPLVLADADLPVDPYLLGCWLGDGETSAGRITKGRDLFEVLEFDGHTLGPEKKCQSDKCFTRTVLGLQTGLRELGLQWVAGRRVGDDGKKRQVIAGHKIIPPQYLRASTRQRTRLLQGLMDTDGNWNKPRKRAVFTSTSKILANGVFELLCTLGQKPSLDERVARGFGVETTRYQIEWTPINLEPFRLSRKAGQVVEASHTQTARSNRRMIVEVLPGPDVETACIAVDSSDSIYLCSEQMIPTHNCPGPTILKGYARKRYPGDQYRAQAHIYGRGWARKGLPVNRVMIFFLPRDGELDDHYVWSEPYDEQVALDAFERVAGIDLAVQALGTGALELLSTHPHYCNNCPFYMRDSKDLSVGCPGDTGHAAGKPQPSSAELISGRRN